MFRVTAAGAIPLTPRANGAIVGNHDGLGFPEMQAAIIAYDTILVLIYLASISLLMLSFSRPRKPIPSCKASVKVSPNTGPR